MRPPTQRRTPQAQTRPNPLPRPTFTTPLPRLGRGCRGVRQHRGEGARMCFRRGTLRLLRGVGRSRRGWELRGTGIPTRAGRAGKKKAGQTNRGRREGKVGNKGEKWRISVTLLEKTLLIASTHAPPPFFSSLLFYLHYNPPEFSKPPSHGLIFYLFCLRRACFFFLLDPPFAPPPSSGQQNVCNDV